MFRNVYSACSSLDEDVLKVSFDTIGFTVHINVLHYDIEVDII